MNLNIRLISIININKFLQKDWIKIKIIKKVKKCHNKNYYYMLIPKILINNSVLIILFKLKKVGVL